jgi:hypothetical protein
MPLGSPFKPAEKLERAVMKKIILLLTLALAGLSLNGLAAENPHSPSHGIPYPDGWKEWGTIAVSHRIKGLAGGNGTRRICTCGIHVQGFNEFYRYLWLGLGSVGRIGAGSL